MKKRDLKKQIQQLDDGLDVENCLMEIEQRLHLIDYRAESVLNERPAHRTFSFKSPLKYAAICLVAVTITAPLGFMLGRSSASPENNLELVMSSAFRHWAPVSLIYISSQELLSINYGQKNKESYAVFVLLNTPAEPVLVAGGDSELELEERMKAYYLRVDSSREVDFTVTGRGADHPVRFKTPLYVEYIYHSNTEKNDIITPQTV